MNIQHNATSKRIDNGRISVAVDSRNGRILAVCDRLTGFDPIACGELVGNVRLLVPLPGDRGHTIDLATVQADRITCEPEAICVQWLAVPGRDGLLAIGVSLRLELLADGVRITVAIDNGSPHVVEEVYCPALGGIGPPAGDVRGDWELITADATGGGTGWRPFVEGRSVYLGPAEPAWVMPVRSMPWLDLFHRERRHGCYIAHEDPGSAYGAWWFQVSPGLDWNGNGWAWPRSPGPQGLTIAWVAFPFLRPGSTWTSAPTVLRFHAGVWYEAARLYREFYDRHFPIDRGGRWLWQEDAWQSTIISYPDDSIGWRFADLPELARQALAHGIRVLQIDGWDIGGLDRDYPHYEPDPRLGGPEELRRAIAACEAMGARVLLFSNLHQVNVETAWYRRELHRYTMRNAFGDCMDNMGWEYNTAGGLIGHRKPRMVDCNPAHPAFAAIMDRAFAGIADLGAAGTQVDKIVIGPRIDLNPDLPEDLPADRAWTDPTLAAMARAAAIGRARRDDFALAAETHWDRLFPLIEVSYARHWHRDAPQVCGATFPEFKQTCCITGPTDFRLVNHCLRLGLVINIEARCLHDACGVVPELMAHVERVRRVRRACWDLLWLGRMADPHGCLAEAAPGLLATRWVGADGGQALVLCHWSAEPLAGTVSLPQIGRAEVLRLDGSRTAIELPARITVAPDEAVVVAAR